MTKINDAAVVPGPRAEDMPPPTTGSPLDGSTRSFMESRFRLPLGDVRVHTGPEAAAAARVLHARAFTLGNHIFFATGQYAPDAPEGRRLLAHELVHVVQQRDTLFAVDRGLVGVGDPQDPLETEAQRVAEEVLGSGPISPIHRDRTPAIRRVVQIDAASATLTVEPSVQKAKPKVDIISAGTRKIAFNHLTEGINLASAAAGKFPVDDAVIKMTGKFDVILTETSDRLQDFSFGFIQIGQVFVLEDTYVGRTLNEGHTIMRHRLKVSPSILLDTASGFAPFSSRLPSFDSEAKGNQTILHQTCNLGILPNPSKKGDSPNSFSGAVIGNRKTNADNFLFETRTDVGFTTVLVAIDPQKKVQPLMHVNWHLVWHFQFRWKGGQDPAATAIPINGRADFSPVTKGPPTDLAIAALVTNPTGAFFNDVTTSAKQQTAGPGSQPPNREDNFSRPSGIPADFFT